jgi:hypothetical protein
MSNRKLRLGAFIQATGHHIATWRHPGSQADSGTNIEHYQQIARTAEQGKLDMAFLADSPGIMDINRDESEAAGHRDNLGLKRPESRYVLQPVARLLRLARLVELAPVLQRVFVHFDIEIGHLRLQTFLHIDDGLVIDQRADFFDEEIQQRTGRDIADRLVHVLAEPAFDGRNGFRAVLL